MENKFNVLNLHCWFNIALKPTALYKCNNRTKLFSVFPFDENAGLIWWHNELVTMCLYLASCPYTICEVSIVNLAALSTPCEWAS